MPFSAGYQRFRSTKKRGRELSPTAVSNCSAKPDLEGDTDFGTPDARLIDHRGEVVEIDA